jgi:acyl-CoA synthetase (AMP-forming)/AMP-acid ligase II
VTERPTLASYEEGFRHVGFLPDPGLTYPQALEKRLQDEPEAIAFHNVKPEGRELSAEAVTVAQAVGSARRAAGQLVARGVGVGDRVILSLAEPDLFFAYFLGAQALGAIPVPLPSVSEYQVPKAFTDRVRSVAEDCKPRVVVVESERGHTAAAQVVGGAAIVDASAASPPAETPPGVFDLNRGFDEIAFIQYTSGSTGAPKGVMIDHRNLVSNLRTIVEGAHFGPDEICFSWLPLFHDMGLIGGFLLGIYMRTGVFQMATRHFVSRPDRWLHGISRFRATFTVAPNFAYSLAARRLPDAALRGLDLSSWRLAFNGAEPIDRDTTERFIARFEPHGFRRTSCFPVYGLAEITLAAAFPEPGTAPHYDVVDRQQLMTEGRAVPVPEEAEGASVHVSVGRGVPGHRLRVLRPDSEEELPERCVGELVLSGPSISPGYYGQPPRAVQEHRTGDLGYVADGHVYVVDRIKDLIIVGGRNIAPSDVERVVTQVRGVSRGGVVAFGLQGQDGTEALHLVVTCNPRSWRALDDVRADICREVHAHFAVVPRDVRFVRPQTVPKTSSGKVQRSRTRELYRQGALPTVASVADRAALKAQHLRKQVGMVLRGLG